MSDPKIAIADLWRQVNRDLHDRFKQLFRDFDLPPIALIFLREIDREPGVTISELARRSGTVKSHVSKLIEQLVQQGLLEKRPDPTDLRLLRIYMTTAAADQKAGLEQMSRTLWASVLVELPPSQVEQVADGLRLLLKALDQTRQPS